MAESVTWRSPDGDNSLKSIVASKIPSWKNGLHEQQAQPILHILDGLDILLCTATGRGKSALFTIPILCHLAVSEAPQEFPKFSGIRRQPVGIVITPTKGLAGNIVDTLAGHRLNALAYDRETIVRAAYEHRDLVHEVTLCRFHVVCVDAQHLISSSWYKMLDSGEFRHNLIFVAVEEVHLVREWVAFRRAYACIGQFCVVAYPLMYLSSAYLLRLSPAIQLQKCANSSGFTISKCSDIPNERSDIQFIPEPLQHAITSRSSPQLLPYLNARRKVVIYVPWMEISTHLYIYLIRLDTTGRPGRRFRQ